MDASSISLTATTYMDNHRLGGSIVNHEKYMVNNEKVNNDGNKATDTFVNHLEGKVNKTVVVDKTDKLYEQCLELEIFLVKSLVSSMRSTIQKSGLVDEGFAGKMYEDMLYDEYARDFTKNANFGLAEQAYRQLKAYY